MFSWREVPFVRLLIAFIIGILLGIYVDVYLPHTLAILFFLTIILFFVGRQKIAYQWRWVFGFMLNITLILMGYHLAYNFNELRSPNHFQQHLSKKNIAIGIITEMPDKSREKWVKMKLKISHIGEQSDSLLTCSGNLLTYIENNDSSQQLRYGDVIALRSWINLVEVPKNPKAFDYQKYLHFQNIHYQAFVKTGEWKLVTKNKGHLIFKVAWHLRAKLINVLQKHLLDPDIFAVGSALILGYKYELSDDLRNAYAGTGAIHVLAVSGLHVGLIYIIITFLLKWVKFPQLYWRILKMMVTLGGVWTFALLTGASASVLRAATMFSFLIIGRTFQRHINIYNTLAISAFLLLYINPYLIKNVGFQLSYMAVLGIIYFQPKICRLWTIENKVGNYLWQLLGVSIAAQIATLPLSLFYFHQFPTYFWLSGLIVVPAAGIILSLGLLLFFFSGWLSCMATFFGKLLCFIIGLVNGSIFLIEQFPYSLIEGIWPGWFGSSVLYLILAAIIIAISGRQFRAIIAATFFLCLLSWANVFRTYTQLQKKQMVIYHVHQNTIIDCFDGQQVYTLRSQDMDEKNYGFTVDNYRAFRGMKKLSTTYLQDTSRLEKTWIYKNPFVGFYEKRVAIIDKAIVQNSAKKIRVDIVLVCNNPDLKMETLVENFDLGQVVFDASSKHWKIKKWREECGKLKIPFYDITEKGAFIVDL